MYKALASYFRTRSRPSFQSITGFSSPPQKLGIIYMHIYFNTSCFFLGGFEKLLPHKTSLISPSFSIFWGGTLRFLCAVDRRNRACLFSKKVFFFCRRDFRSFWNGITTQKQIIVYVVLATYQNFFFRFGWRANVKIKKSA